MSEFRLFFTTDIHGSEVCFRKFLNAARAYDASVLVLGGDITGKVLVPMIEDGAGRYRYQWLGPTVTIEGSELERIEHEIRLAGAYSFRTTPDRLAEIQASPELSSHVFVEAMVGVARDWVKLAEERLAGRDVQCFIAPGNDDDFGIDTVLGESGGSVSNPEGQVIELRGTSEMIVCGYSNPTPWATPREEPEDDLLRRIEAMADKVSRLDRAVFCLHVPPYGSGLDNAALLDETLKPRVSAGSMIIGPVGSTAVRDAIRKYQPMVALHGHIHEGRGVTKVGRTPCINPGSEYGEGVLRGALLVIDDRKGLRSHVLVSG